MKNWLINPIPHPYSTSLPFPSGSGFFCGSESKIPALSFDAVKEAYCQNTKTSSLPSVDGALFKNERFLLVEIKSWQNFERYQIKPGDSPAVIQNKIEDKAKGFKLKPKVEKSIEICKKRKRAALFFCWSKNRYIHHFFDYI